ncbi:hypothetical protein [Pararhizobium sp. A13]|uniref:hypothetical protein n=1 Tax=Pararhizobium sp. A13 TaxID=3133975 RepID=UPI00324ED0D7
MADVTQELIHEMLRRVHVRADKADTGIRDLRRLSLHAHQNDTNTLYTMLHQTDERLERIENRLELRELAEAQSRFEPHP